MIPALTASNIFSKLGNEQSLVPMAIKDIANSCGLTAGSYVTGDTLEGKDRFIDEFGTQAIWLFGIPTYKKIIDLTLYKLLKIDSEFDVRNLKKYRSDLLKKSIEYSDSSIKNSIKSAAKNKRFTKNLAITKFITSTLLTIVSYWGLTKYRHNLTQNNAKKEILKEISNTQANSNKYSFTKPKWTIKDKKQTTFTGLQDFMYNPVKNLMILDGAITTERIAHSRNRQDLIGYTIKEGTFWAFMYFASKPIKKFLEKSVDKNNKIPASIELDSRIIESNELKEAIKDGTLKQSINKILKLKRPNQIMDFVHNNTEDFTVKMAKMSDILPVLENSHQADNIDYRKFIDFNDVKDLANKLDKLNKKYLEFQTKKMKDTSVEAFMNNVIKQKRISTIKNIGACISVLGIFAPLVMVMIRKLGKENSEFQVKKDIRNEIATIA